MIGTSTFRLTSASATTDDLQLCVGCDKEGSRRFGSAGPVGVMWTG